MRDGDVRWRLVAPGDRVDALDARAMQATGGLAASNALPLRQGAIAWIVVSFLRDASPPPVRCAVLGELVRVLAPTGTMLVIDHNRPRRRVAAAAAIVRSPRPRGATPRAAWRRLAYPTAREALAVGIVVDRLRLAGGERVQVVSGRRAS